MYIRREARGAGNTKGAAWLETPLPSLKSRDTDDSLEPIFLDVSVQLPRLHPSYILRPTLISLFHHLDQALSQC